MPDDPVTLAERAWSRSRISKHHAPVAVNRAFVRYHLEASPPLRRSQAIQAVRVQSFAGVHGVSPGIVVGRLQRDGLLEPGRYNDLKRRVGADR